MRCVLPAVGSGYVGLSLAPVSPSSATMSYRIDKALEKIERLRAGGIPIYEPGLDKLVDDNARAKRLTFDTDLKGGVATADVVFIAVGTPGAAGRRRSRPQLRICRCGGDCVGADTLYRCGDQIDGTCRHRSRSGANYSRSEPQR